MKLDKDCIRKISVLAYFIFLNNLFHAQIGVNILTPHPTAALQIQSPPGSHRGLLTPSMTSANRAAMNVGFATPADGLIVYDTDHKMHYHYNGTNNTWKSMSPLSLTTPTGMGFTQPFGVITTPSSTSIFSLGINKQNPSRELDVQGSAAVSGNVSVGGSLNVAGFPSNALVPAGTIVMFHGSTIPNGWAICNGASGTPDLRGRFIVAAGQALSTTVPGDLNPNYIVNTTGGENRHTLSKSELPRHHHQANGEGSTMSVGGGSHQHATVERMEGTQLGYNASGSSGNANYIPGVTTTFPATHTHNTSDFSGRIGDGTADGLNNQPHENRPQYYALLFIMKL